LIKVCPRVFCGCPQVFEILADVRKFFSALAKTFLHKDLRGKRHYCLILIGKNFIILAFSTPEKPAGEIYKIKCIDGSEFALNSKLSAALGKALQQGFVFDFDSNHVPISTKCPALYVKFSRKDDKKVWKKFYCKYINRIGPVFSFPDLRL